MKYRIESRCDFLVEAEDDASAERIVRDALKSVGKVGVEKMVVGATVIKGIAATALNATTDETRGVVTVSSGDKAYVGAPPKPAKAESAK